jgi:hypothetical protein
MEGGEQERAQRTTVDTAATHRHPLSIIRSQNSERVNNFHFQMAPRGSASGRWIAIVVDVPAESACAKSRIDTRGLHSI